MAAADELLSTEAERVALGHLRRATGVLDGPMERHCVRARHIAARVAARRGWVLDGEVLTVAALPPRHRALRALRQRRRLHRRRRCASPATTSSVRLDEERVQVCAEAIERHHELRRQTRRGAEVEALRLADLIDVSAGWIRFGLTGIGSGACSPPSHAVA